VILDHDDLSSWRADYVTHTHCRSNAPNVRNQGYLLAINNGKKRKLHWRNVVNFGRLVIQSTDSSIRFKQPFQYFVSAHAQHGNPDFFLWRRNPYLGG